MNATNRTSFISCFIPTLFLKENLRSSHCVLSRRILAMNGLMRPCLFCSGREWVNINILMILVWMGYWDKYFSSFHPLFSLMAIITWNIDSKVMSKPSVNCITGWDSLNETNILSTTLECRNENISLEMYLRYEIEGIRVIQFETSQNYHHGCHWFLLVAGQFEWVPVKLCVPLLVGNMPSRLC